MGYRGRAVVGGSLEAYEADAFIILEVEFLTLSHMKLALPTTLCSRLDLNPGPRRKEIWGLHFSSSIVSRPL